MAKRFTDTEKWKKPFMRSLPSEYKLFWLYLIDDINHAGIWQVDLEVAELRLGTKLSLDKARGLFKERVVAFDNGTKWFIPDFLLFQYGELNESSAVHKSVLKELKKYNLLERIPKGCLTLKAKAKDKAKAEEIEKRKEIFISEIEKFTQYPAEMRKAFCNYWAEFNASKTKMRFELQETFENNLRLAKWANNNKEVKGDGKSMTVAYSSPKVTMPEPMPNYYSKEYDNSLSGSQAQVYHQHLRDNGWKSQKSPDKKTLIWIKSEVA